MTSSGGHLVRRDLGADTAAEVARDAVMPLERAGGQAQFIVHETPVDNFGQIVGTTPLAYRRAFYRGKEPQSA